MRNQLPALALLAACLLPSCRKNPATTTAPPAVIAGELKQNQLAGTPSSLLRSWADSKVHWQQWSPEILDRAKDAQRLVFAVIGSVRYPGTFETLEAIESRPDIVARLNEEFVPVLVDLDISRETSLFASALSSEARQAVSFPFLLLLSPAGDPVSWQPLAYSDDEMILNFFDNSVDVIIRLWKESPAYVTKDSATKNEMRRGFIPEPDPLVEDPAERLEKYRHSIRRLTSFYEADLSSLSGAGGLFPVGALECLGDATIHPQLDAPLRERASSSLRGMLGVLERSAMIDPLDGGIYSARRGPSWDLPIFVRDCVNQARAIRALCRVHESGVQPSPLPIALGAVAFAESHYLTTEGLFAMAANPGNSPQDEWLWTTEQLLSTLDNQELQVWKSIAGINRLGNLPSEADPRRKFFRLNSLALRKPIATVAEETNLPEAQVRTLLESGRKKLLKVREQRFPVASSDPTPSATASFRMISAYAALHTATGNPEWRDKAAALGQACRKAFGAARFLNERPGENPEKMSDGRAYAYAVASQAALDLGAVTLEDEWNLWAQDLSTLLAENFITEDGRLVETRAESRVISLTYSDRLMVFEESTAGLTRLNLSRLASLGFQIPPTLHPWTISLPPIAEFPIVHTDSIGAIAHATTRHRLAVGPDAPADLVTAVAQLPLTRFERRMNRRSGADVELMSPDGTTRTLAEVAEITALDSPTE